MEITIEKDGWCEICSMNHNFEQKTCATFTDTDDNHIELCRQCLHDMIIAIDEYNTYNK
jgi:hypothetical protein